MEYVVRIGAGALVAACAIVSLSGCTGTISDPHKPAETNPRSSVAGPVLDPATGLPGQEQPLPALKDIDCTKQPVDPGSTPLRTLSRTQYLNTVSALVGSPVPGVEEKLAGYIAPSKLGVGQGFVNVTDVEGYDDAAALVASSIVTDAALLAKLAPCAAGADPSVCATTFIKTMGARAYRAPIVDNTDIASHLALFKVGLPVSYAHGIELLLEGVLQSARFLYQVELGTNEVVSAKAVKLSPYELAARLSYAIWEGPPNDKLVKAAVAGELASKEGVTAQLDWMLTDPQGANFVNRFLGKWTAVERTATVSKDPTMFPDWAKLQMVLRDQAQAFFAHLLTAEGGTLRALLTSPTVMANQDLSGFYGATAGAVFQPVQRTDGSTSGLLTLPAWLAVNAKQKEGWPIYRGVFVRESLLCQTLPTPPNNVPQAPEVTPGVSTRERLKQHKVSAVCAGCHVLIDPIGLGFENYDAIGRYRTQDGGQPVDASGELTGSDSGGVFASVDGAFTGPAALGSKLAESAAVQQCMTQQWFRYVMGRIERESDACSVKSLVGELRTAGQSLNALPRAAVLTDAFLYRRPIVDAQVKP